MAMYKKNEIDVEINKEEREIVGVQVSSYVERPVAHEKILKLKNHINFELFGIDYYIAYEALHNFISHIDNFKAEVQKMDLPVKVPVRNL